MSTGEVADTYAVIIADVSVAMRAHDRMPVILTTGAARRWIEPGPLPAEPDAALFDAVKAKRPNGHVVHVQVDEQRPACEG